MKKHRILAAILAALLICLAGCGGTGSSGKEKSGRDKGSSISAQGVNTIKNAAEFSLVYLYTGDKVIPPKPNGAYSYSEADEGMIYLVIVMDVKNLGEEEQDVDELLEVTLALGSQEIKADAKAETDDGTSLDRHHGIPPLVTARVHYLFEVPENAELEELSIRVKAGDRTIRGEVSAAELAGKVRELAIGDAITDEQTLSAQVEDVFFTNVLKPEEPSSYYHYFEADPGKTYLVMKLTVKNLKGDDQGYDTLAGVKCVYDGKYNYSGFTVFEKDGGGDLSSYANSNSLAPLEENVVYFLMEIPQEAESGPLAIELYIAGQYCRYCVG